jgi:Sulfotransferase domain
VTAKVLAIDDRLRRGPWARVRPADFAFHETGTTDSSCVFEDPTLSLYCIDTGARVALFVRTPPEVDLSRASFLYQTQYEAATELVSVPFDELHRLAAAKPLPPDRLVQVCSTGRCGSTLVSHAFAAAANVVSLSEPDVYNQLHFLRDEQSPEFEALVKTCTIVLCAPRPAGTWAVKFRSPQIELAEPLLDAFPGAKTVFLYRQADSYARSAARAFGSFSPERLADWDDRADRTPRPRSLADRAQPDWFRSPADVLSWLWSTSMLRALALQQRGVPMFIARYEELKAHPAEVLTAMFDYCGVSIAPEALAAVLAKDSQEGTGLSRATAKESTSELTEEHRLAFRRCLAERAPALDADQPMAGTFTV